MGEEKKITYGTILPIILLVMALVVASAGLLTGWVISQIPTEASENAPQVVMVTTCELNVRRYPHTGCRVFAVLPEGTPVCVQLPKRIGIESWARVELPEGYFWVCYSQGDTFYLESAEEEEYAEAAEEPAEAAEEYEEGEEEAE